MYVKSPEMAHLLFYRAQYVEGNPSLHFGAALARARVEVYKSLVGLIRRFD